MSTPQPLSPDTAVSILKAPRAVRGAKEEAARVLAEKFRREGVMR